MSISFSVHKVGVSRSTQRGRGGLEEEKRATTNVQNGLVVFFSFKNALIWRKSPGGNFLKGDLEEDKHATTNVQNGLVLFFFLF